MISPFASIVVETHHKKIWLTDSTCRSTPPPLFIFFFPSPLFAALLPAEKPFKTKSKQFDSRLKPSNKKKNTVVQAIFMATLYSTRINMSVYTYVLASIAWYYNNWRNQIRKLTIFTISFDSFRFCFIRFRLYSFIIHCGRLEKFLATWYQLLKDNDEWNCLIKLCLFYSFVFIGNTVN